MAQAEEEQYAYREEDEDDVPLMAAAGGGGATSIRRARTMAGVAGGGGRSTKRSMGSSEETGSNSSVSTALLGRSNTVNLGTGSAAARERHVGSGRDTTADDGVDVDGEMAEQQERQGESSDADIEDVQYYSPHQQSLLSRHSSMPVSRATRRAGGGLGSLNEVSALQSGNLHEFVR